jgi:hypothetical protein
MQETEGLMKYMVISNPRPDRPSEIRGRQAQFWDWLDGHKKNGTVEAVYVKTGRGAVLIVNVDSHEALHRFITEWSDNIPAEFTVTPLIDDPGHQERIARGG